MARDSGRAAGSPPGEPEVMASIDGVGRARRLIIADVTGNDRWLSVPLAEGVSLSEWR